MLRHLPSATRPHNGHEVEVPTVSGLEVLQNYTAPGLQTGGTVRGGVRVLSDQAGLSVSRFRFASSAD